MRTARATRPPRPHGITIAIGVAGIVVAVIGILVKQPRPDPPEFEEKMRLGSEALALNNLHSAHDYFTDANKLNPIDPGPLRGLGSVAFKSGDFNSASSYFKQAYQKKAEGPTAYAIGQAEDALGHHEDAITYFQTAKDLLNVDSDLRSEAIFDLGLSNMIVWMNASNRETDPHYAAAEQGFRVFLENKGRPQWAHYSLACLQATRSVSTSSTQNKKKLQLEALRNLQGLHRLDPCQLNLHHPSPNDLDRQK